MSDSKPGSRGIYSENAELTLPYKVFDADHHFYPVPDALTRHLPADMLDRAWLPGESTEVFDHEGDEDEAVDHERRTIGVHSTPEGGHGGVDLSEVQGMDGNIPIPGAMLNKLNPMRELDQLSRTQLVERYNEMRPAFEHKDPRLKLMDVQGVELSVLHAVGNGWDSAFSRGDLEAGYAVNRSFNDWLFEDWGYAHEGRIIIPVPIPLYDVDHAVAELKRVLDRGAKMVDLMPGPAYGRSPFDPTFDPFWQIVNDTNTRVAVHLGGGYQRHGDEWGENPNARYKDFNGFQWVNYWADRPIMETVTAMMYHNLFGRFPKIKVLIAEFGTVWVPYLLRKLDHAAMLGRKPKWGDKLPGRPTAIFKERCIVAPYPEENVQRPMEVVGADCLVFGSDFPHSEGLPDPLQYVAQLKGLDDVTVKKIMRDNLARFLTVDV